MQVEIRKKARPIQLIVKRDGSYYGYAGMLVLVSALLLFGGSLLYPIMVHGYDRPMPKWFPEKTITYLVLGAVGLSIVGLIMDKRKWLSIVLLPISFCALMVIGFLLGRG